MITAIGLPRAEQDADRSAAAAGVEVRELTAADDMSAAAEVLRTIWRTAPDESLVHPSMLVALAHGGNYVVGAFDRDRMVGVCIGFFGGPRIDVAHGHTLHSHIAGVLPSSAGHGVGTALKLHQRLWCLRRDVQQISWTFDPLITRNASFNLHRLGASVSSYLIDFYGSMTDGVNAGQPTDRLLVDWQLRAEVDDHRGMAELEPMVTIGADGRPVEAPGGPARFGTARSAGRLMLPADIEALRRRDPETADQWQLVTRRWLGGLLDAGWSVSGFDRQHGYLLASKDS